MADDRTARDLQKWFRERGYLLAFERRDDSFRAVVMYADRPAATALAVGEGTTRYAAAHDAYAKFQGVLRSVSAHASMPYESLTPVERTIETAVDTEAALPITPIKRRQLGQAVETDTASSIEPEQPVALDTLPPEALSRLGALHVQVAVVPVADGWQWFLASGKDGEILQSGTEAELDDAKLEAIIDAYPPSAEDEPRPSRRWDH